ncbi:MAG: hypothetical protein ACE5JQ_16665 [Candidatus Methylomirabilales bacterium]
MQVAAVQADIVTHSTGGLLARRLPLLGKGFFRADNFGVGDVHKLVNIGTPNLGTQVARFLRQHPCVARFFNAARLRTDRGGIRDLVPGSRELRQINRAASPLLIHYVIGQASDQQKRETETSPLFEFLKGICRKEIPDRPPGSFFDEIHRTPEHDLIAAVPSQRGGSLGPNASTFEGVIHTRVPLFLVGLGEPEAAAISRRVIELLNRPAGAPLFAPFRR